MLVDERLEVFCSLRDHKPETGSPWAPSPWAQTQLAYLEMTYFYVSSWLQQISSCLGARLARYSVSINSESPGISVFNSFTTSGTHHKASSGANLWKWQRWCSAERGGEMREALTAGPPRYGSGRWGRWAKAAWWRPPGWHGQQPGLPRRWRVPEASWSGGVIGKDFYSHCCITIQHH